MATTDEAATCWRIGLHDAHCHPTDINGSLQNVPQMKTRTITIMATRISDQRLVHEAALRHDDRVVPAFGHHPWFTHLVYDDTEFPHADTDASQRIQHFQQVLRPALEPDEEQVWLNGAGDVIALSQLLAQLRENLQAHPLALVGEVGLDKSFRIPEPWAGEEARSKALRTEGSREGRRLAKQSVNMAHQIKVLEAQLRIAGEFGRPVSVHGVQAHGVLNGVFRELWKGHELESKRSKNRKKDAKLARVVVEREDQQQSRQVIAKNDDALSSRPKPFPPRICLHSYSGNADNLKQYFHPSVPSVVYASFSIAVNFNNPDSPASARAVEAIKWIPQDRLLIESDLHQAGADMDEMMEQIARKVCLSRGWALEEGVQMLADNYKRFIGL